MAMALPINGESGPKTSLCMVESKALSRSSEVPRGYRPSVGSLTLLSWQTGETQTWGPEAFQLLYLGRRSRQRGTGTGVVDHPASSATIQCEVCNHLKHLYRLPGHAGDVERWY